MKHGWSLQTWVWLNLFLSDKTTILILSCLLCLQYLRDTPCDWNVWGACLTFVPFWCFLFLGLLGTSNHLAPVAIPPGRTGFYWCIFEGGCGNGHFATTLKRKGQKFGIGTKTQNIHITTYPQDHFLPLTETIKVTSTLIKSTIFIHNNVCVNSTVVMYHWKIKTKVRLHNSSI